MYSFAGNVLLVALRIRNHLDLFAINMRILLLVAIAILCGCTGVVVREPIGERYGDGETASLAGKWRGPDGTIITVSPAAGGMTIAYNENEERFELYAVLTTLDSDVPIVWFRYDGDPGYQPIRISPDPSRENCVALLCPDDQEIRRLVDQGVLFGKYDDQKGGWFLENRGLVEELKGKRFWDLDNIIPLLKLE